MLAVVVCCVSCGEKPNESALRFQFASHQSEFKLLAAVLERQGLQWGQAIRSDGCLQVDPSPNRPQIHADDRLELMRLVEAIGVSQILVDKDGGFRFIFYSAGSSFGWETSTGILHMPVTPSSPPEEIGRRLVGSIERSELRRGHDEVPGGHYVSSIAPEWYVFRLEFHD
jgi:hypothetical protein